jgi:hypothetical protein
MLEFLPCPMRRRKFNGLSVDPVPMVVSVGSGSCQPIGGGRQRFGNHAVRQQLRIVERKQPRGPHIPRWQKVPLAALAMRLKGTTSNAHETLAESIILFKPETVLGWHRAVVRWKWTFKQHQRTAGRPRIEADIEALVVQMARHNSRWGYDRIAGELRKLGITLDPTTVKNILERHGIPPAPQRGKSNWRTFLKHYQQQMLACDFLTVETLGLRTCGGHLSHPRAFSPSRSPRRIVFHRLSSKNSERTCNSASTGVKPICRLATSGEIIRE